MRSLLRLPLAPRAYVLLTLACAFGGCHADDEQLKRDVRALAQESSTDAARDADGIASRYGRRALPLVEEQLHTADAGGRKNLIVALRKIGDADAVPLLGHLAGFDGDETVRKEAEWTLRQWAAEPGPRGEKAKAAVRTLDEQRGSEGTG